METFTLSQNNEEEVAEHVAHILQKGGIVVYPTDTVYGLGIDSRREDSIRRLYAFKNRPFSKPIPLLVSDIGMAKQSAFIGKKQEKILEAVWPGPMTCVFCKKERVSSLLSGGGQTIGLRAPSSSFCLRLIRFLGAPVSGTSANISGEHSSSVLGNVLEQFRAYSRFPDAVVDGGDCGGGQASTVVDFTRQKPKILRVGPASPAQMRDILMV